MSYAEDTEYASENLITLITKQQEMLEKTKKDLASEEAKFDVYRLDFTTSEDSEDFSDIYVQEAHRKMAQAKQKVDNYNIRISNLENAVEAQQKAIQAMCGALLQIVKQGISIVHGGINNAPDGRSLGRVVLKDVIWQARNQSMHYEEGNFHNRLVSVFSALETEYGSAYSLSHNRGKNLAKEVIYLLGWNDLKQYKEDLKSLGLS